MVAWLRSHWHEFRSARPGHRFRERYERARKRGHGMLRKWGLVAGGALLVLAGIVFLPLPGPGFVIIAAGGLLMAEVSKTVARGLDWLEVRVRSLFSSLQRSR